MNDKIHKIIELTKNERLVVAGYIVAGMGTVLWICNNHDCTPTDLVISAKQTINEIKSDNPTVIDEAEVEE